MDNNEDEEIVESLIDDLHTVNLLICILNQLPKGCILTLTDYIYSAFADGWLLKLKDYMNIDGVYYLFELSQDCIHYIEKELLSSQKFNLSPQMMKYREVLQMPTKVIIPLQPYKKTINFLPSFIIRF